jgi:hypothetical protein
VSAEVTATSFIQNISALIYANATKTRCTRSTQSTTKLGNAVEQMELMKMTSVVTMEVEERGKDRLDAVAEGVVGIEIEEMIDNAVIEIVIEIGIDIETEMVNMVGAKEVEEKDEIATEIETIVQQITEAQGITIENGKGNAREAVMKEIREEMLTIGKGQGVDQAEGEKAKRMAVIHNAIIRIGAVTIQMTEVNTIKKTEIEKEKNLVTRRKVRRV